MPTATAPPQHQVLEATVTRVNGRGFTIQGRDGWLNVSKYAPAEDVPMPQAGDRVELTLDGQSFVRKVVVLDGRTTLSEESADLDDAPSSGAPDRQTVITRLAVLNTATAILAAGSLGVDPDDVLALAARLEYWATR